MAVGDLMPAGNELIEELSRLRTARARSSFLRKHRELLQPAVVGDLYDGVVRLARVDLQQADRLAIAAASVAEALGDEGSLAQSLRAAGHVRFVRGQFRQALEKYRAAARLFRRAGREVDLARTLNGSLQTLISLGRHEEAHAAAREARSLFSRHSMALGLARLDTNVANIFSRQDRFDRALRLYERAYTQLSRIGDPQDVAAVLSNLALCYINLNDFEHAMQAYESARAYCEQHQMPLLVLQADYNIAYLYYLRGEYTRALDMYRVAHEASHRAGDEYHHALCDLDRSEMYLELNMGEEAGELAERARGRFADLHLPYEEAKSVTNLALATSRRGDVRQGRALFARARRLFARERNVVWLARVDFHEALGLYRDGQSRAAREMAQRARRLFARAALPGRAASCDLLLARLDFDGGRLRAAERVCRAVAERPGAAESPLLAYQSQFLLGLIREAQGDSDAAIDRFRRAHGALEHLRSRLPGDNVKMAFLEDKQAVYESLVATSVGDRATRGQLESAFGYIESAKSRSLADLIAFRTASLSPRGAGTSASVVPELRQALNVRYRQVELEETRRDKGSARRVAALRRQTRVLEKQLGKSLDEVRRTDEEFSAIQRGASFDIEEIRASLPADTMLLEYYQARGQIYVCLLGRADLDVISLGPIAQVRSLVRLLQFQLSKFGLGPEFIAAVGPQLHTATESHLHELYDLLIAPVRERLTAAHLVIVPHDVLHSLPFHALFDGRRYLLDQFTVSYAPSASVYRLCRMKLARSEGEALVMGVPDAATPLIADEVRSVSGVLPNPRVFVGAEATSEQLKRHGGGSRFVHIATHGLFRRDNPMFSSIRLGDGPLSVYDLYGLDLRAELVTLSGCSTGLSVVMAGDEQLGLVRGLLYAGARSVLLTLWDVHDGSTADFMKGFYARLQAGWTKARAAQEGMRELRERYPHPFYWAPFSLIGNVEAS